MVRTSSVSRSRKKRACLTSETRADRDFPEVGFQDAPDALAGRLAGTDGAKADGQPVQRPGLHQRMHLAGAGDAGGENALDIKAALVLADGAPGADGLGRIVLVEHADTGCAPLLDGAAESAALDDILTEIDLTEDAGITGKGAIAGNAAQFQIGEFARGGTRPAINVHGKLLRCEGSVRRAGAHRNGRRCAPARPAPTTRPCWRRRNPPP
jgi:hypothetical protein